MKRALLLTALFVPIQAFCGAGSEGALPQEPPSEFSQHIVWENAERGDTHFIPVARLQESTRTSLPINPREIEEIESLVDSHRRISQKDSPSTSFCQRSYHSSTSAQPRANAVALAEYLQRFPLLAHGKVIEIVAGLGYHAAEPQTLIYVEIDEILGCRHEPGFRAVTTGDVVSIAQRKGAIRVDGETLCNETDQSLETPSVGEEVIVGGNPQISDPYFLGTAPLFRVVEGSIRPQPYSPLSERSARDYLDLRGQFQGSLVDCRSEDLVNE